MQRVCNAQNEFLIIAALKRNMRMELQIGSALQRQQYYRML